MVIKSKIYLRGKEFKRLRLLAIFLIVLSVAGTWFVWATTVSSNINSAKRHFGVVIQNDTSDLSKLFDLGGTVLYSGRSLISSGATASRQTWNNFYDHLDLTKFYPSIKAVAYLSVINSTQIQSMTNYLNTQQLAKSSAFKVYSAPGTSSGKTLAVVTYIAPSSVNQNFIGYDVFSNPLIASALTSAAKQDTPALAAQKLTPLNGNSLSSTLMVALPVYNTAVKIGPVQASSGSTPIGYIAALINANTLFNTIFKPITAYGKVGVTIKSDNKTIYSLPYSYRGRQITKTVEVKVANRTLSVFFNTTSDFGINTISKIAPYSVLVRGLFFTGMLILTFYFAISVKLIKEKYKINPDSKKQHNS